MTNRRSDAPSPADAKAKTAATREARGSVQEAIGKLIGDDAARERGTAEREAGEREAGTADASDNPKPSRP